MKFPKLISEEPKFETGALPPDDRRYSLTPVQKFVPNPDGSHTLTIGNMRHHEIPGHQFDPREIKEGTPPAHRDFVRSPEFQELKVEKHLVTWEPSDFPPDGEPNGIITVWEVPSGGGGGGGGGGGDDGDDDGPIMEPDIMKDIARAEKKRRNES